LTSFDSAVPLPLRHGSGTFSFPYGNGPFQGYLPYPPPQFLMYPLPGSENGPSGGSTSTNTNIVSSLGETKSVNNSNFMVSPFAFPHDSSGQHSQMYFMPYTPNAAKDEKQPEVVESAKSKGTSAEEEKVKNEVEDIPKSNSVDRIEQKNYFYKLKKIISVDRIKKNTTGQAV
jgi:hypothetical protein